MQMLILDQKSVKTLDGSPLVKMSANCSVVVTLRTRTSPVATRSGTKCRSISMRLIEVDHAYVVAVDEADALKRTAELVEKLTQLGGLCHVVG
jgi:tyrosine-protein phosphatase YwqE